MRTHSVLAATLLAALCAAAPVQAADPVAEALYREGRDAAQHKDWEKACARFEESQKREAAPGTLLNLADCEDHRGKLVLAIEHFESAAHGFRAGDPRVGYAKQRAAALHQRTAWLTTRLDPASPSGATVERNAASVDMATMGTPTEVDPGEHVLVVRAQGRSDARTSVSLAEGESREVEVQTGALLPTTAGGKPAPSTATAHKPAAGSASRAPAFVAFGVGGVGIVVGAVTGLIALNDASSARDQCPSLSCPSSSGVDAANAAKRMAFVSTAAFEVGLVGAAVGTYLLLTLPGKAKAKVAPAVGQGSAGAMLQGSF